MTQVEFEFSHDGRQFENLVFFEDGAEQTKPAVMIFHAFEGRNTFAIDYAKRLAKEGYVACAIDMYGDARVATDLDGCLAMMMPLFEDRGKLKDRLLIAFNAVKALPMVDESRIASMGFCFGGLCALDLARTGVDMKAAISFHGVLSSPSIENPTLVLSRLLILHGYDDPQVGPRELAPFAEEMTEKGADWQMHYFSHTQHAFTDPEADLIGGVQMGRVFHPQSAQRAWCLLRSFLAESL